MSKRVKRWREREVVVKKGPAEFVYEGETTAGETGRLVFRKATKERKARKARKAKEAEE